MRRLHSSPILMLLLVFAAAAFDSCSGPRLEKGVLQYGDGDRFGLYLKLGDPSVTGILTYYANPRIGGAGQDISLPRVVMVIGANREEDLLEIEWPFKDVDGSSQRTYAWVHNRDLAPAGADEYSKAIADFYTSPTQFIVRLGDDALPYYDTPAAEKPADSFEPRDQLICLESNADGTWSRVTDIDESGWVRSKDLPGANREPLSPITGRIFRNNDRSFFYGGAGVYAHMQKGVITSKFTSPYTIHGITAATVTSIRLLRGDRVLRTATLVPVGRLKEFTIILDAADGSLIEGVNALTLERNGSRDSDSYGFLMVYAKPEGRVVTSQTKAGFRYAASRHADGFSLTFNLFGTYAGYDPEFPLPVIDFNTYVMELPDAGTVTVAGAYDPMASSAYGCTFTIRYTTPAGKERSLRCPGGYLVSSMGEPCRLELARDGSMILESAPEFESYSDYLVYSAEKDEARSAFAIAEDAGLGKNPVTAAFGGGNIIIEEIHNTFASAEGPLKALTISLADFSVLETRSK